LAKEEYPNLDVAAYLDQIPIWRATPKRMLAATWPVKPSPCRISFIRSFHGNAKDYYDLEIGYLSDVMDRLTAFRLRFPW